MSATFLSIRSNIRPGVAIIRCTVLDNFMISSFKSVPPVVTITFIFRCFDSSTQIWLVCSASSRVGTIINAINMYVCRRDGVENTYDRSLLNLGKYLLSQSLFFNNTLEALVKENFIAGSHLLNRVMLYIIIMILLSISYF